MNKNNRKISAETSAYEWAHMPQSYLLSAYLLCSELKNHKKFLLGAGHPYHGSEIFKNNGFPPHQNYHIIFPAIFNLKHGIELYIKGLSNKEDMTYIHEHDLLKLFDDLISESKDPTNKVIFTVLKNKTWPIIKKYYFGTYIAGNIEANPDLYNQAERYPHRQDCYEIPETYEWVDEILVTSILEDIKLLEEEFRSAWIKIKRILK